MEVSKRVFLIWTLLAAIASVDIAIPVLGECGHPKSPCSSSSHHGGSYYPPSSSNSPSSNSPCSTPKSSSPSPCSKTPSCPQTKPPTTTSPNTPTTPSTNPPTTPSTNPPTTPSTNPPTTPSTNPPTTPSTNPPTTPSTNPPTTPTTFPPTTFPNTPTLPLLPGPPTTFPNTPTLPLLPGPPTTMPNLPGFPFPTTPGSTPMPPLLGSPITGPCDYWLAHPEMINQILGMFGSLGNTFSAPPFPSIFGGSPTVPQALQNTRTDGFGSLLRECAAALLNSVSGHQSGAFPFSTRQVQDSFLGSLASNSAAAAQAEVFKAANEGRFH